MKIRRNPYFRNGNPYLRRMKSNPYLGPKKITPQKHLIKISPLKIISIALIIFFVIFAIWGIKKLGDRDKLDPSYEDIPGSSNSEIISPQLEDFKDEFQGDINKVVRRIHYSEEFEYSLPEDISKICFESGEEGKIYFVPEEYGKITIKNIDIENILKNANEGCFDVEDGIIQLILEKGYYGSKVTIGKVEQKFEEYEENFTEYNSTQVCNGTWKPGYYEEGIYECDKNTTGCNISSCLCGGGFYPDLDGGCYLTEYPEEDSNNQNDTQIPPEQNETINEEPPPEDPEEPPITKYDGTLVSFSKSEIAAKSNMESSIMLSVTDVNSNNLDVFFEDVSNIGFEFTGNPNSFTDVSSGRTLLQTVIVPEGAYPGKYSILAGAIPSNMVSEIKNLNGGTLPALSSFPEWGFETDMILLNVNGINYAPTIDLLAEQDANTEGTTGNPFHSGEVLLRISIVEDEGYIASYMPRWDWRKVSGSYCNPGSDLQLYGGNGLSGQLIVPPVSTRVNIKITATVIDGIFSVSKVRNIYVDPSGGCGL